MCNKGATVRNRVAGLAVFASAWIAVAALAVDTGVCTIPVNGVSDCNNKQPTIRVTTLPSGKIQIQVVRDAG